MLIVTNFRSFPERWTATSGETGISVGASTPAGFNKCRHDAVCPD